jgi:hypothetical protein
MIAEAYNPVKIVKQSNINQHSIESVNPFDIVCLLFAEYIRWKIFGSIKVIIAIKNQDNIYEKSKSPLNDKWLPGTLCVIKSTPPNWIYNNIIIIINPAYISIN